MPFNSTEKTSFGAMLGTRNIFPSSKIIYIYYFLNMSQKYYNVSILINSNGVAQNTTFTV